MDIKTFFSASDKRLHLKLGTLFALGCAGLLLVAWRFGPGYAIGYAGIGMGWGVERYQAIRHEGTPSDSDWFASALPSLLLGIVVQVLWSWFGLAALLARWVR